ncbi:ATP-binding protein [Sphaerospermopsis aphanizomenoides BCCUSP55]|uniref:ATP-binding protein n=1 Tax=Sphaerospermopsis aphanizomenoides TaxID=459663 RepID=UPI001906C104|nr:ATP-binding protein [Sphaerospermopsis aphanizomenoides]MBK1990722.1 ATP-binding protein [Sphaerospermopsis aphanizomenoides BCCUSP55]
MTNGETKSHTVMSDKLALLSQLEDLRNIWQNNYPKQAKGGLLALSGFEYQFLLILIKLVNKWKNASNSERQNPNTAHDILTEFISDITESGEFITLTQAKRTLSNSTIASALEEFWLIFNLASEHKPDLLKHLRFVISGSFEDNRDASAIIKGWDKNREKYDQDKVADFKKYIHPEIVPDPKVQLKTELENLSRDEDTETTIGRWLGYLIQIGSGISSKSVSAHIWQELRDDKSLEAFWATRGRLVSQSNYWLRTVKHTLGVNLSLPRTDTLSQLQTSVLAKRITLLIGSSGSGKSALCKLSMQNIFQNYTALFLNPKDIFDFTDALDSDSKRETRRIDELITAQAIEKPLIIIDDLGDANDQNFSSVLNLIQNVLTNETSPEVRFILVAHLDAESSICEKIAARIGTQIASDNIIRLPQLPIDEIKSSNVLPDQIANLVQRADEFGPALNMKFLDSLIRSNQEEEINTSFFRNELDLLNWYWVNYVGNGNKISEECHELIKISLALAEKFTPDLSKNNLSINSQVLYKLIRRDCLRIAEKEDKVAITHRFVGDCARFRYLLGNCRDVEVSELVTKLKNPLWSKPIRWFALYLAMESEETEIWQELFQEALAGEHLQLVDVLLDGAILSRQPSSVLNVCLGEQLPFLIERLFYRLFAIATDPIPDFLGIFEGMSASEKLLSRERTIGTPKAHLWQPVWLWVLEQHIDTLIEKPNLIFKAAEVWINCGIFAEKFPLKVEVAELILNLAQRVFLPDPELQKHYGLDDSSTAAFACIVFALRLVPERSTWLVRALSGREIIPANRLEPTKTSRSKIRPGIGILTTPHPKGPSGQVNYQFRNFMLSHRGVYLRAVMRVNLELGAELLLALTITEPSYFYESDYYSNYLDDDLGTKGSDDLDICTFKFLPLLYLFQINEELAIDVVSTLSSVATDYWHEHRWKKLYEEKNQPEEFEKSTLQNFMETDVDKVTLLFGDHRKNFKGGRNALYWHRQALYSPRILTCFLMTLEGWLYSRPTKAELKKSASIIFERADTVAMLGVLISLAKCDPRLVSDVLLPLTSSLQLLIWQEFEKIDQGQDFGLDTNPVALRSLSEQEGQELLEFHRLPYRKDSFLEIVWQKWILGLIPTDIKPQILKDWDDNQITAIPNQNSHRALRIRTWFDQNNWLLQYDEHENIIQFRFVGNIPESSELEVEAQSEIMWKSKHCEIIMICRNILDSKQQKNRELNKQCINILNNEEQITLFESNLNEQEFRNVYWALITRVIETEADI